MPAIIIKPVRGEVYLVNFDPTIGTEIAKTRPALVTQNDIANEHSPITIVAAITSKFDERLFPTEVQIEPPEGGLKTTSVVLLNQVRSIDRQRLSRRLGVVSPDTLTRVDRAIQNTLTRVDRAIQISLGLVDF
jgi:mRNA interferase MazF